MSLSIRENVPLRDLTTFRVGGLARYFCVVTNETELVESVRFSRTKKIPFFVLGGGSNIVVGDSGWNGLVIKMEIKGISCDPDYGRDYCPDCGRDMVPEGHQEKIGQLTEKVVTKAASAASADFSNKNSKKTAHNSVPLSEISEKNELSENNGEDTMTCHRCHTCHLCHSSASPHPSADTIRVTAGAGENWDDFVGTCVARGFHGLENLSGIPGTVGAAPVQNIGAYGSEVSQTIASVRVFDATKDAGENAKKMEFIELSAEDCHFGYRDSIFKHKKYIIVSATFNLKKNAPLTINYKDVREYFLKNKKAEPSVGDVRCAIIAIRAAKLPDLRIVGTAGSFFKNPIISQKHFAELKKKYPDLPSFPVASVGIDSKAPSVKVPLAWILDHICGYKGAKRGNVGTYKNQALVIVNDFSSASGFGGAIGATSATALEIKKFAEEIAAAVKEKTDIDIEPEVQYVGE